MSAPKSYWTNGSNLIVPFNKVTLVDGGCIYTGSHDTAIGLGGQHDEFMAAYLAWLEAQ